MSDLTAAAGAFAQALPATAPLSVANTTLEGVPADAQALAARYVGARTYDLLAVGGEPLTGALDGAKGDVNLSDVLHAALTQAATSLGDGVLHLDNADLGTFGQAAQADKVANTSVFALEDDQGTPVAWLVATEQVTAPTTPPKERAPILVLKDVEMNVSVQIGRTRLAVRELLSLAPGALLELDRPAGAPADVLVNNRLIARGEIVVVDEDYGVRITEVLGTEDE